MTRPYVGRKTTSYAQCHRKQHVLIVKRNDLFCAHPAPEAVDFKRMFICIGVYVNMCVCLCVYAIAVKSFEHWAAFAGCFEN